MPVCCGCMLSINVLWLCAVVVRCGGVTNWGVVVVFCGGALWRCVVVVRGSGVTICD